MDKIKGLGDVVEIITRYTGIKYIVKKFFGEDCGCDRRQEFLNKEVPLSKPTIKIQPPMMPPVPKGYTKNEK